MMKIKSTIKCEIIVTTSVNIGALLIMFVTKIQNTKIHVMFHDGSRYDYHFIIKELAEESEGQCECS